MVKFNPLKSKSVKDNGTYLFADFSKGLYMLDTPRALGEQLGSLALVGGRNVIAEKGALVPQYGYEIVGELPEGEFIADITKGNYGAGSFFIVTQPILGACNVYLYTSNQGLKKYKSTLPATIAPIITQAAKHLVAFSDGFMYLFGGYYDNADAVEIASNVTLNDYDNYYTFSIDNTDLDYYWNGKDLLIDTDHFTVVSITPNDDNETSLVRVVIVGDHKLFSSPVTISEKSALSFDAIFFPEDYNEEDPDSPQPIIITPQLLEMAMNRLCIVDISGRIYYSQVGAIDVIANTEDPANINGFREEYGAGYFEGFYGDTTKTLAIEDYLTGALITKEDGFYYLTLTQNSGQTTQTGSGGLLSIGSMDVNIKRISQLGQQYATDHVIERENVYAYDTWSGNIVLASYQNVFGTVLGGEIIIDAKTLNAQNFGIASTKRCLMYSAYDNLFVLYYGTNLNYGIILTPLATLFPRQLNVEMMKYIKFNQGIYGVTEDGKIIQEYKNGTIIRDISANAEFEAIGLRDNRFTVSTLLEITELNAVDYSVTTKNAGMSVQSVKPPINIGSSADAYLPPLIYSDKQFNIYNDSYELTSRWADKKANVTRIYAPMSGREGVQLSIEFAPNVSFCLAALRLPDFSQGE